MPKIQDVFQQLIRVVESEIPQDCAWRLVVIGSAAAGEVTINSDTGEWLSDIEAYIESPDPYLKKWISSIRNKVRGMEPSIDISGGDPSRMMQWEPRQWIIDAGRKGQRLAGFGDTWEEPFLKFASCHVPKSDAAVLLSNRCAGLLEQQTNLYVLAKAVIDVVGAALIFIENHQSSVRDRLLVVQDRAVREKLRAIGVCDRFVDRFIDAANWKLSGDQEYQRIFQKNYKETLVLLRLTIRELLRRNYCPEKVDGADGLESWAKSRGITPIVRDWVRSLKRTPSVWRNAIRWRSLGPLWGARIDVVRAWTQEHDDICRQRALGDWKLVCKGV